jgi:hypothetical protein
MASLNLYIRDADEVVFERLKKMLEKEGRSISEFMAEAANRYVDSKTVTEEEIEIEGNGVKRIFTGHTLYWRADGDSELGVFLTAKGKIAFWYFVPRAINPEEAEEFEVYETLDELWEEQDWLQERKQRYIKQSIEQEYAARTGEPLVERLDI